MIVIEKLSERDTHSYTSSTQPPIHQSAYTQADFQSPKKKNCIK